MTHSTVAHEINLIKKKKKKNVTRYPESVYEYSSRLYRKTRYSDTKASHWVILRRHRWRTTGKCALQSRHLDVWDCPSSWWRVVTRNPLIPMSPWAYTYHRGRFLSESNTILRSLGVCWYSDDFLSIILYRFTIFTDPEIVSYCFEMDRSRFFDDLSRCDASFWLTLEAFILFFNELRLYLQLHRNIVNLISRDEKYRISSVDRRDWKDITMDSFRIRRFVRTYCLICSLVTVTLTLSALVII